MAVIERCTNCGRTMVKRRAEGVWECPDECDVTKPIKAGQRTPSRDVSTERCRAVEATLEDVWEARKSPHVSTGINGWPTLDAINEQCDFQRKSVNDALLELTEANRIRRKLSRKDFDDGQERPTYNPRTPPGYADESIDWSDVKDV